MKFKTLLILTALFLGILPTFAKFDGKVSQDFFYDTERTIMTETLPNTVVKTEKYWSKNVLMFNKYRPLFMLSNKDLYNLMPKTNTSIVQRITTPSIYNISLKTSSIISVSLKPISEKTTQIHATAQKTIAKTDATWLSLYEEAKNANIDSDKKIETAILLKNSQKITNYYRAIALLDSVTKNEPYNAYAFYVKGEIYAAWQKPEIAMENYIEALKLNPTSKQSYLGIAKILENKNKELAKKYYEMAEK